MDDHIPSRFSGPHPAPVWQDPRSLELIRTATSGGARAQTLALYLALTERGEDNLAEISERAGLTAADTQASMKVLTELRLVEDGALVG
jgi:predicted transcriptional regulator